MGKYMGRDSSYVSTYQCNSLSIALQTSDSNPSHSCVYGMFLQASVHRQYVSDVTNSEGKRLHSTHLSIYDSLNVTSSSPTSEVPIRPLFPFAASYSQITDRDCHGSLNRRRNGCFAAFLSSIIRQPTECPVFERRLLEWPSNCLQPSPYYHRRNSPTHSPIPPILPPLSPSPIIYAINFSRLATYCHQSCQSIISQS